MFENLSKYFGIDPWYYYIGGLENEFGTIFLFAIIGFCLLSVRQLFGSLKYLNRAMKRNGLPRSHIPTLFVYVTSMLYILSTVDHKERRFCTPIVQLACLF